jgi:CubicO group peptidase (beta-lactamase class C family)
MFAQARQVLLEAVAARACPAVVVEVGTATTPLWAEAFGTLTYGPGATQAADDTIFDLASLTKVLATTPVVMQMVERGELGLDDPVSRHVRNWRGADRADVTIRDLLAHCSGLPAYLPLYLRERGERAFLETIARLPLAYAPRTEGRYSDLDMILLGIIVGGAARIPERLASLLTQMGVVDPLQYRPPPVWLGRTAPTAFDPWRGRLLIGEVDDANAWALGGVAGHAGLFGTAAAVGASARHLLQVLDGRTGAVRRDTLEEFTRCRNDIPGSSHALGWDTMRPTSSCGRKISRRAFGHTGFTGTSLWIDPDRGAYVVLLSNRVHPNPLNTAFAAVRPALHDAVMDALDSAG